MCVCWGGGLSAKGPSKGVSLSITMSSANPIANTKAGLQGLNCSSDMGVQ